MPGLLITEVMAWPSTNTVVATADWWELTNLDTTAVSLLGWKFFDTPDVLLRGIPCPITQAVTLQPAESIIFVEGMTRDAFVAWWGATNLPPHLTILPCAGFGLSMLGDTLYLWNTAATDPLDAVTKVIFALSTLGLSRQWAPGQWVAADSAEGVDGASRAVQSDDVGSPGYSHYAPPRFLDTRVEAGRRRLTWQAIARREYRLQYRTNLDPRGDWRSVGTYVSPGRSVTVLDNVPAGDRHRFCRVELLP